MVKNIFVVVTEADAEAGERWSGSRCPVALALRRQGYESAIMRWSYATVAGYFYRPSPALSHAIADYDHGAEFPPGEYQLTHE